MGSLRSLKSDGVKSERYHRFEVHLQKRKTPIGHRYQFWECYDWDSVPEDAQKRAKEGIKPSRVISIETKFYKTVSEIPARRRGAIDFFRWHQSLGRWGIYQNSGYQWKNG